MSKIIWKDLKNDPVDFPIYAAATDCPVGMFLKPGATGGTDLGALIKASGASAIPDMVGRLAEALDYSEDGETLGAGTKYVTKAVQLIHPFRVHRLEFDLTAASACAATEAVSTTTMTVTSLEDNIDASFLYVVSGTGAGQTNFLTASASGSCTLKAAFTTSLSTDSYFIKILRRFHQLVSLSSDGTKLASQVAAGAVTALITNIYIARGSRVEPLDPTKHAALQNLDDIKSLHFYADVAFRDALPFPVD